MNYAFIDNQKKPSFLKIKPEIFTFETGNNFLVFPGRCKKKRLNRALSKYKYSFFPTECNNDLKTKIWYKLIIQTMKEYGFDQVVFCSENYMNNINLLTLFFENNIIFSIISLGDCDEAANFFLKKYGLPVRVMAYSRSGLVVYIDGFLSSLKNNILDLSGTLDCEKITVSEYILKNTLFPITINSLPLLEGALNLTGKEIEDIIVKLCIIGTNCE